MQLQSHYFSTFLTYLWSKTHRLLSSDIYYRQTLYSLLNCLLTIWKFVSGLPQRALWGVFCLCLYLEVSGSGNDPNDHNDHTILWSILMITISHCAWKNQILRMYTPAYVFKQINTRVYLCICKFLLTNRDRGCRATAHASDWLSCSTWILAIKADL